jgi:hypothetical protein
MVKQQLGTSLLQRNKRDGSGEWNDEQPTWGARLEWITSHQSTAVDYGLLLHFDGCTADKLSTTYITASGRRSRTLRLKVLLLTPKRLVLHVIKHFVRRRDLLRTSSRHSCAGEAHSLHHKTFCATILHLVEGLRSTRIYPKSSQSPELSKSRGLTHWKFWVSGEQVDS